MSSGQWEVVGKSKKSQNGKTKNPKEDEKKPTKNETKIASQPQVKSYYAGMEIDDSSKPPKEQKKGGEKKNKKQDKKSESLPYVPPKDIAEACKRINLEGLVNVINMNKDRFSNAPLVWLKEVAIFLNSKLQDEFIDFEIKCSMLDYPLCHVTSEVRSTLTKLFQDAGKANTQLFFDITLTALTNDMSKDLDSNGNKILLQLMAREYPEFCVASIPKAISLTNSYRNRPLICLFVLWSISQGGFVDFQVSYKVLMEVLFPMFDLKNYTKYVMDILLAMIKVWELEKPNTSMTIEQYLNLVEIICNKVKTVPKDTGGVVLKELETLRDVHLSYRKTNYQVTFNQIMKKLPNQYLTDVLDMDDYNRALLDSLHCCLISDGSCNMTWRQLFHKYGKQSATLIAFLDDENRWDAKGINRNMLKTTIIKFMNVCEDTIRGKKKDEIVAKTKETCQHIFEKMSKRGFPWLWACFLLLVSIAGLITYDVSRVNGEFPKSATGKLLNDFGILEQSQHAWRKTLSTSARGYLWLETNVPVYYETTVETCTPYAELSKDLVILGFMKMGALYGNLKEYVVDKTPVVVATIEQYAPGAIDTVQSYAVTGYATARNYTNDYYEVTLEYLKTQVFVGEWAPEILQNKTQLALNATRTHMSSYFHWFREQVGIYSEIP